MALVLADRVRETTTTTGTGAVTLGGAYIGFQTFSATVGNANTTYYTIANLIVGEWEVGIGTYTSGSNTLSRDTVLASSNSGSLVNFTSGSKDVFVTQPAERNVYVNGTSVTAANGATIPNSLLANSSLTLGSTPLTLGGTITTVAGLTLTGAALNGTLGATTPSTGAFTTLSASSTVSGTGFSTYLASPPAIGGTTAAAGSFTTLSANAATTASSNKGAINYGTLNFSDTGIVQSAQTSVNSYFQNVIQNTSNGASASSEFIAYNDQGTATTNFAAFGINSSGYSGTGSINAAGYAYFLSGSTDLVLGTIGSNKIHFTINSGATDAMLIDTSGNVGIGTSSPGSVLDVQAATSIIRNTATTGTNQVCVRQGNTGGYFYSGIDTNAGGFLTGAAYAGFHWMTGAYPMIFATNNAERMRIDSSGNVGIGTSSPTQKITIGGASTSDQQINMSFDNGSLGIKGGSGSNAALIALRGGTASFNGAGMEFYTNNVERARIDSSGNLLVGTTASVPTADGFSVYTASGNFQTLVGHASGTASGIAFSAFRYNNAGIGSITQAGTTGVLYNVTSDYRLKEVIGTVSGSGERIDAVQPIDYMMKSDGSVHRGFLAHQFQEVYGNSVAGAKDALDETGNPIYQQMQASSPEVIADLFAELQSLRKRVAQLESK